MKNITNGSELVNEQLDVVSGGVTMLDAIAPIFAAAGIDVYNLPDPLGDVKSLPTYPPGKCPGQNG